MAGIVACTEPPAVDVGRLIFAKGGNVADVAVATAYAQAVVNPFMCGLAGKASIHFYDAQHRKGLVLDAGHTIGSRATPTVFQDIYIGQIERVGGYYVRNNVNAVGYQAIMTPGFVPATQQLFERFGSGRLPWSTLLEPAIDLARDGFTIYPEISHYWDEDRQPPQGRPTLRSRMEKHPTAYAIYYKGDGRAYRNGERLVQRDLAKTLTRVAQDGAEVFYKGEVARRIAADIEAHNGFVTYEDMANFVVEAKSPVYSTYRGYKVAANPPPGNGMVALIMLNILEGYDLASLGHNSSMYIETVARAMQCAFDDRARYRGDPNLVNVPLDKLLSKEYAAQWRERIAKGETTTQSAAPAEVGTTHLAVMDSAGNTVSMTHSIGNAGGAGVVTEGLGFLYNNHMGLCNPLPGTIDSIVPGRRQGGSIPTIVYWQGEPLMAVGAAGGTRQVTSTVQTILNVLDFDMNVSDAIAAPRVHCEEPGLILVEEEIPESSTTELGRRDFRLQKSDYMGRAVAVYRHPKTHDLDGGADLRGGRRRGQVGYFEA